MSRVKTEIPATLEEAAQAGRVCMDVKKDGQFCYHIYLEPDFAKLLEAVEPLNIKKAVHCGRQYHSRALWCGIKGDSERNMYVCIHVCLPGRRGKQDIKYGQGSL